MKLVHISKPKNRSCSLTLSGMSRSHSALMKSFTMAGKFCRTAMCVADAFCCRKKTLHLAHSTERTMLCPACAILSQLPVCTGGWRGYCSTGPSRVALCSWAAPKTDFTFLLVLRALRGTHMIESIRVDSCIQEDPGYLLMAMQCCIMKAVHLFLRGKSEERTVSEGFSPEAVAVTDYPQRAPCSLLQEFCGPALTNSWRLSPVKPVPGSFTCLFVKNHIYLPLNSQCHSWMLGSTWPLSTMGNLGSHRSGHQSTK